MEKQGKPWFKFWAREFLGDQDVANTPDSAMLLIVKMWCVCCLEGSCPADEAEIARLTRTLPHRVSHCVSHFDTYFERIGDRLYSRRMERDRERSELARKSAEVRWKQTGSGGGNANRIADRNAERSANRIAPEDQKTRGPEPQESCLTEGLQMGLGFVPCGKVENSVEIAPRGACSHEFPGQTEAQRAERIRLLKDQAQTLLKKGNGNTNPKNQFYPSAAEA
jgi:uncharacterized protein YdaU (DUF1376 family)